MLRFIIPVAAVGAAVALQTTLTPVLGDRQPLALLLSAVLIAAWAGGRAPGLLAAGLGLLATVGGRLPVGADAWVDAAVYLGVATAIAQMVGGMHAARERSDRELSARRDAEQQLRANLERREQAERALRVSDERFHLAADALHGLIYDLDPASGFVLRTRGLHDLIGFSPDDAEPTEAWWRERIHPDDLERVDAESRAGTRDAGRYAVEYRVRHRDDHWIWVRDSGLALRDSAGGVIRIVGNSIDVTAHREAEASLREADDRKDRFLATLAHELRNPLGPIRSAAGIVREIAAPDARVLRACEVLDRQVSHMARLIDDLLDVSRMTRGHVQLRREFVDLNGLVEQGLDQARPLIEAKAQTLTIVVGPEPIGLHADPVRIVQIVANLVTNAAKYTDAHGRIAVSAERQGPQAVIRVRDTGVGIAPEFLPKVFDVFVQGKSAAARTQGGLGIGLTLVREFVAQHGGVVEAYSAGPGTGAEFTVRLPSVALDRATATRAVTAPPRSGSGLRILLVEDNADAAESLALLLELAGHEVRVAADGGTGVDLAEAFRPDVGFIDIGLPGIDGYEVARRLRAHAPLQRTTLVALTGYGQPADEQSAREAGFDHHFTKPVDLDRVRELLAQCGASAPISADADPPRRR